MQKKDCKYKTDLQIPQIKKNICTYMRLISKEMKSICEYLPLKHVFVNPVFFYT